MLMLISMMLFLPRETYVLIFYLLSHQSKVTLMRRVLIAFVVSFIHFPNQTHHKLLPECLREATKACLLKKYGYKICCEVYLANLSVSDSEYWLKAMKEEIRALEKNNIWNLVEVQKNCKLLDCKWV